MKNEVHSEITLPSDIPDGYVTVAMENGQTCVVPEALLPATAYEFAAYTQKLDRQVWDASGGVSIFSLHLVV